MPAADRVDKIPHRSSPVHSGPRLPHGSGPMRRQPRLHIADAIASAEKNDNLKVLADIWRIRIPIVWQLEAPDTAADVSLSGLRVLELLRLLMPPGLGRIGMFTKWSNDYHVVAGYLLRSAIDAPARRALAFEVMERMRARALLEARDTTETAIAHPADGALTQKRKETLDRIASLQRRLLRPSLSPHQRTQLNRELVAVERHAEALREALWRQQGGSATYEAPTFASVNRVQKELGPREAMLLFQVGLDRDISGGFGGGAWVWVLTRKHGPSVRHTRPTAADGPGERARRPARTAKRIDGNGRRSAVSSAFDRCVGEPTVGRRRPDLGS